GPDGAIYFIDWHNPIIGHMQNNLRDPSRDREHGRIYKVTYKGRERVEPVKIAGEPVPALLELLKSPEDRVRYRAKIELGSRDTTEVIAETRKWLAGLPRKDVLLDEAFEHARLEALWVHQYHNVIDIELLKSVLASPEPRARAAAVR